MKLRAVIVTLIGTAVSANAAVLITPSGSLGGGVTYMITGDVATETGDGAGEDLRFTSNAGGSFTIAFTGGAVDLTIFNSEVNQAVNFDANPTTVDSAVLTADSGTSWAYAAGTYDLTNATEAPLAGSSALSGLGTNVLTIGSTRGYFSGAGIVASGAPASETDWGVISISGVTSITYAYTDQTNFDAMRIDATVVPEPSSVTLLGLCGLGLLARRRR